MDGKWRTIHSISLQQCTQPGGSINYVLDNNDYDDSNPNIGAPIKGDGATSYYYSSIQGAYDEAFDGNTIQIIAVTFTENLSIDLNKSVTFEGGFSYDFSTVIGSTTINGNITITDGTVTMDNFLLQ